MCLDVVCLDGPLRCVGQWLRGIANLQDNKQARAAALLQGSVRRYLAHCHSVAAVRCIQQQLRQASKKKRLILETAASTEPATVFVIGEMKTGKSSLLNALLCEDVLPTDAIACTTRIATLRCGLHRTVSLRVHSTGEAAGLSLARIDAAWTTRIQNGESLADLLARTSSNQTEALLLNSVSEVVISLNLLSLCRGYMLVDSPGLAERTDLNLLVQKHLTGQGGVRPADIVLYVVSAASGGLKERDIETLEQIPAAARDRLMVVVTKVDLITSRSDEDESDDEEEKRGRRLIWRRFLALSSSSSRRGGSDCCKRAATKHVRTSTLSTSDASLRRRKNVGRCQ